MSCFALPGYLNGLCLLPLVLHAGVAVSWGRGVHAAGLIREGSPRLPTSLLLVFLVFNCR